MSVLSIEQLYFSYNEESLLSGISLHCSTGEVLGLLGNNGCGKSTLFKVITGMLYTPSMILRIDNKPVHSRNRSKHIAYLSQESFLPQELRINKCIQLFLRNPAQRCAVSGDKRIKELNNRKIRQLSGGERRYLELLLICAGDQEYALLDEPFSELDPIYREKAITLINNIRHEKGIILTDQDYRSVLAVSSTLLLLANGELKHETSQDELIMDHYLPGR